MRGLFGFALLISACLCGCEKQPEKKIRARSRTAPAPAVSSDSPSESPVAVAVAAGEAPWITPDRLPWEAWYLQYMNGTRIGYSHVVVSKSSIDNNSNRVRINRTDRFEMVDSQGTRARFTRNTESIEFNDGRLSTITDSSKSAAGNVETEGNLIQSTLTLTTTNGDEKTAATVPWEEGTWGLMGIQAILMQKPPQAGEFLQATVFVPQLNKIAKTELLAGQPEITALPSGKTESLLPVDVVLWADETGMTSRNWINERGEVMKTISLSGPSMSTFRAPAEIVQRTRDEFLLADMLDRQVPIQGYEGVADRTQVAYELERSAEATSAREVYSLLSKSANQKVVSLNALVAEVTVTQLDPNTPAVAIESGSGPDASCLISSTYVPADNPVISQLAEELKGQDASPLQTALKLTSALHEKMTINPFNRELTSTLQVARQMEGDCTEAASLLTTLLRSQKIPARIACGLIVSPNDSTHMIFHMWTEAWLNDRWVPLDATRGGIAGCDRLKILDSSLNGENPYGPILSVYEEMSGLNVRVKTP